MQNITELNEQNFETEVLKEPGLVLVDFFAPWCGPCKMLAPLLDQLAGEFSGKVKFTKLDVDGAPELSARYEITGVPTLILFRAGRPLDQVVGFASPRALKSWLANAAAETAAA